MRQWHSGQHACNQFVLPASVGLVLGIGSLLHGLAFPAGKKFGCVPHVFLVLLVLCALFEQEQTDTYQQGLSLSLSLSLCLSVSLSVSFLSCCRRTKKPRPRACTPSPWPASPCRASTSPWIRPRSRWTDLSLNGRDRKHAPKKRGVVRINKRSPIFRRCLGMAFVLSGGRFFQVLPTRVRIERSSLRRCGADISERVRWQPPTAELVWSHVGLDPSEKRQSTDFVLCVHCGRGSCSIRPCSEC